MNEPIVYGGTLSGETAAIIALVAVIAIYVLAFGFAIAQYIMTSLSMYTLAKRRYIDNAFLAWIPIGDMWILGQIADNYDARLSGKKGWGKILLTLTIVGYGMLLAFYAVLVVAMIIATAAGEHAVNETMLIPMIVMYVSFFIGIFVLSAAMILKTVCIYKVFESTVPNKAVKYTALTFVVPLAGGICLLKAKGKGYPEPIVEQIEE